MRRVHFFWLGVVAICLAPFLRASAQSQTQSLGDYARAVRKNTQPAKTSARIYDNDNIPKNESLSVVGKEPVDAQDGQNKEKDADKDSGQAKDTAAEGKGSAAQEKDSAATPKDQSKSSEGEKKDDPQLKAGQSAEERQKAITAWKQKLDDQKGKVDLAARDLDVTQREYQLKSAEFYADTARRAQNPNGFAGDEAKFKEQIAQKQKALDDAKSKLDEMQDDARKQGAPNSVTE